jgi:type IX secretion system PorP/SprF family membrane protein
MKRGFLILLFCFFGIGQLFAQQNSLFSQYMFNGLAINPGYAGSHDVLSLTASARKQWVGVEGAPSTMTFSAHTPLNNEKVSVGLLFYGDKVGIFTQQSLNTIYAYKIKVNSNANLSFGLQAGINNYVARYTQLTSKDPNDPALSKDDVSGFAPSFGSGVYYYTEKFYAGISSPFLINNLIGKQVYNNFKIRSTYFLTAGRVFFISDDVKLKPSVLIKYVYGAPLQADINANVLLKNVLWVGASLRNFSSANFLTQFNISAQLKMGYSYDLNLTKSADIYSGAHEIMVSYLFSFNKSKVVTPRYF